MTAILGKEKKLKNTKTLSKADRLAIKMGGRRFNPDESFESPFESDAEFEDFLNWLKEMRKPRAEEREHWLS